MTRRLVIFDVDGTLVDSQAHIVGAMTRAFTAQGLAPLPRETVLSIVGLSLPQAVARLLPDAAPALCGAVVESYKDSFAMLRAQDASPLYPGARETLEALRARDDVLLGVATGKSRRGLDHLMAAHGLQGWFVTCQVADDHPSKPHPSMLLTALDETGASADGAVMIGDTVFDIEMGRAAGVRTLGVSWGYHPVAALEQAGADRVIHGFEALIPALDAGWGGQ